MSVVRQLKYYVNIFDGNTVAAGKNMLSSRAVYETMYNPPRMGDTASEKGRTDAGREKHKKEGSANLGQETAQK